MRSAQQFFRLLAVTAMSLLFLMQSAAQGTSLTPLLRTSDIFNIWWSADSRQFTFQYVGGDYDPFDPATHQDHWYTYNVTNNIATQSNQWSLQPTLTNQILQSVDLADDMRSGQAFSFVSPNGEFIIVSGAPAQSALAQTPTRAPNSPETHQFPQVAILDTTTNQIISTGVEMISNSGPDRFRIQWGEDGRSFTVTDSPLASSDFSFFYYVSGYADEDASQRSNSLSVRDVGQMTTEQGEFRTREILDLSPDSEQVLLRTALAGAGADFMRLLVWEADTNSALVVEGLDAYWGNLRWAAFVPEDTTLIRAVTVDGLIEYNLATGQMTVLRSDLNAERFKQAMFSPDGRYVALVEAVSDAEEAVYVVPVG